MSLKGVTEGLGEDWERLKEGWDGLVEGETENPNRWFYRSSSLKAANQKLAASMDQPESMKELHNSHQHCGRRHQPNRCCNRCAEPITFFRMVRA